MTKWRLLVGICSLCFVAWGVAAFVEYSRAVGATGDAWAGWIYSGLRSERTADAVRATAGLPGLDGPACGCTVQSAVVRGRDCAFAAWCVLPIMHLVAPLILMIVLGVVLLCGANAIGTWQLARPARR